MKLETFKKTIKGISFALLLITASIAIPIFFRPFYYMQIKPLGLTEHYSYTEIVTAYDELLNYLTLFAPFKMGNFAYSHEGYLHFKDVKILFLINNIVLIISLYLFTFIDIKQKNKKFSQYFYASISVLGIFAIIGLAFIISPDGSFVAFHKVLFPGKDNWTFDYNTDPIINILPFGFFLSTILFVAAIIVITTLTIIIYESIKVAKKRKKERK